MKTCQAIEQGEECTLPVFGKGYCKFHQHYRIDKKQKPICKMKAHTMQRKKEVRDTDKKFYMSIWEERPHYCAECTAIRAERAFLGNEPLTYHFDHILEKGESRFANLRHEKKNIQLICFSHHQSKTSGHLSEFQRLLRESTIKYFEEKERLPKLHEYATES